MTRSDAPEWTLYDPKLTRVQNWSGPKLMRGMEILITLSGFGFVQEKDGAVFVYIIAFLHALLQLLACLSPLLAFQIDYKKLLNIQPMTHAHGQRCQLREEISSMII